MAQPPVRRLNARPLLRVAPDPVPAPPPRRRRIGLLGGSFNPAHAGHLHASLHALKRLRLDAVWWLVSPQNPLKATAGMVPFAERLAGARALTAGHPRLRVSDVERRLGTRYTVDTLRRLTAASDARFVWLIGADNLGQLPQWKHWRELFRYCAIAVIDRDPYSYRVLKGKAAVAFARRRVDGEYAANLMDHPLPAWTFLRTARHPASSTAIRAAGGRPGSTEKAP